MEGRGEWVVGKSRETPIQFFFVILRGVITLLFVTNETYRFLPLAFGTFGDATATGAVRPTLNDLLV